MRRLIAFAAPIAAVLAILAGAELIRFIAYS
jgi:hypothetical protein